MNTVIIELNGQQTELEKGLTKIADIYENSGIAVDEKRLYLDKSGDIDIPLSADEYIIIHGGEVLFPAEIDSDIEDNPSLRNPIQFELNGEKITPGLEKAKVKSKEISCRDEDLESPRLFVDLAGKVDDAIGDNISLVVQDADSYFTVPSSDDDLIDLEECSKKERRPPKGQKYKIKVDKQPYKVEQQEMTGSEILALAAKNYSEWSLNQKLHGGRRKPIEAEEVIDFSQQGIERFETVMRQAQQG